MRLPWFVPVLNIAVVAAGTLMLAGAHNTIGRLAAAVVIAAGAFQLFLTIRAVRAAGPRSPSEDGQAMTYNDAEKTRPEKAR